MAKPMQGFNSMQGSREIPTTDPRAFRGGQVATSAQRMNRLRGMGEGYLSSIMDLPMRGMEALAPDAGYTPGELRSSPKDRARGQRYAWEDYQQGQAQDPDYAAGMDLGEDIALVADPFFDIPLSGAAKMAPHVAKALRSETLGADAMQGMRGLLGSERGAIDMVPSYGRHGAEFGVTTNPSKRQIEGLFKKAQRDAEKNKTGKGSLRYSKDADNNLYVWDSYGGQHDDVQKHLGFKEFDRGWIERETQIPFFGDDVAAEMAKRGERGAVGDVGRMERARELGYTTEAYSGSTHDIKAFRGDLANPEGDWGRGTYASTSIEDVNKNYAGEGADLTGRIESRSERIADDLADDEYVRDELLEEHGISLDEYEADEADVALRIARKELTGSAEGGVVYPLRINTKNYAVIGGQKPTSITSPDFYEAAKKDIDRADYDDVDDYEDAINDLRYELEAESEESLSMKVSEAMRDTDLYQDENVMQDIMGELDDEMMEGDLRIDSIDDAIRRHVVDAYDDEGNMLSAGDISSQVLKNLGFDGVVDMKVYQKFGAARQYGTGMEGINPDTAHIITFPGQESTIRSKFAKFDPTKTSSSDLLAGTIPAGFMTGMVTQDNNQ